MSATTPEPIAQGDLAKTPFAHVLLHLHHKQMSGTLVVWPTAAGVQGQDRILFQEGWPVMGRLIERAAGLDRGMLPLFARKDGPYAFYEGDLVGDAPLKGRVDPLMVLTASLRGSTRDDIVGAYLDTLGAASTVRFKPGLDIKRYQLQPKEAAFVDVVRAAPATVQELLESCELGPSMGRRLVYLLFVTKSLERFEGQAARPAGGGPASPASPPAAAASATGGFDLPLPDMPVPEATGRASAPGPAPKAPTEGSGPSPTAARPSMPSQSERQLVARFKESMPVPPPPPAGLSADATAFWHEVIARCKVVDQQNYYDMLEVKRDAGGEAIRKQYFALAKRWHPDRATGELSPLRPYVERVFALFTSAQETLGDEKKRGNYLRQVQEGGGTPEADRKLEAILWAAKEHQKAEILVRRRDFEAATALLSAAIAIVSDESDLLSTYAWCLYNLPINDGRTLEMMTAIDRALAIEPKHDKAHYFKGMIQLRNGKDADAAASFRKALELNPKNTDAAREVRLVDMRSGKSGTTGKNTASKPPAAGPGEKKGDAGGFLSKLFGGGKTKKS